MLLVAAAGGAVIAWLRRRSARRRWAGELESATEETHRLTRDVVPSLLTGSRESRRAAWSIARTGAVATEDKLAALARSAPDEQGSEAARGLAGALGELRSSLDAEVQAADDQAAVALQAVRASATRLDERLAEVAGPPAPGPT